MSCANNVLPVYMWPSPGKIPEALCLPPVQVDTVHFSSEATETNGFSRLSSSLNRTAVGRKYENMKVLTEKVGCRRSGTDPVWIRTVFLGVSKLLHPQGLR